MGGALNPNLNRIPPIVYLVKGGLGFFEPMVRGSNPVNKRQVHPTHSDATRALKAVPSGPDFYSDIGDYTSTKCIDMIHARSWAFVGKMEKNGNYRDYGDYIGVI